MSKGQPLGEWGGLWLEIEKVGCMLSFFVWKKTKKILFIGSIRVVFQSGPGAELSE
jgi:hypothetical protein